MDGSHFVSQATGAKNPTKFDHSHYKPAQNNQTSGTQAAGSKDLFGFTQPLPHIRKASFPAWGKS